MKNTRFFLVTFWETSFSGWELDKKIDTMLKLEPAGD